MWTLPRTKNIRIYESHKFGEDGTQQSGEVPPGPPSRLLPSPLLTSSVEVAELPNRWFLRALCFDWLTFATANTLAVSVIKIINPRSLTQTCFMASAVIISQHISLDGDKVDHSVITKQSGRAKSCDRLQPFVFRIVVVWVCIHHHMSAAGDCLLSVIKWLCDLIFSKLYIHFISFCMYSISVFC